MISDQVEDTRKSGAREVLTYSRLLSNCSKQDFGDFETLEGFVNFEDEAIFNPIASTDISNREDRYKLHVHKFFVQVGRSYRYPSALSTSVIDHRTCCVFVVRENRNFHILTDLVYFARHSEKHTGRLSTVSPDAWASFFFFRNSTRSRSLRFAAGTYIANNAGCTLW